jgi:Family of unknown function (DUF6165)
MSISVKISAGELLDKITILVIKLERMSDPAKLSNVRKEYDMLMDVYRNEIVESHDLVVLRDRLKQFNERIWDTEDEIRDFERRKDFGERFVELARSAYLTNDRRSSTKREINDLLKSTLVEEKSYSAY